MSDTRKRAGLAALLLVLFAIDAVLMRSGWTAGIDSAVLHLRGMLPPTVCDAPGIAAVIAGQARATWPDTILLGITLFGEGVTRATLTIVAALALIVARRPRLAALLIGAMMVGTLAETVAKRLFERPRPDVIWWHACWLSHHLRWSFPSGHATGSMILYPLLGMMFGSLRGRAWAGSGIALAFAVGVSRALLGVHWASDVIGGWLLGAAILTAALGVVAAIREASPPAA